MGRAAQHMDYSAHTPDKLKPLTTNAPMHSSFVEPINGILLAKQPIIQRIMKGVLIYALPSPST